ncbi:MAG: DUF3429 domain-containing protein [Alphaproteobacteria bacterium]|nr:DUF3429 domain-containing protein [Alphaproteobacteria bacterium]MCW5742778.1 DUF3429 domain-containing protein [Alphaproteobacteria bacterium]
MARPSPPAAAIVIGVASLVPFIAGVALAVYGGTLDWRLYGTSLLSAYAACALSFLGAVHWGLAMREQPVPALRLAISIVPVLVGFVALAIGGRSGLTVMAAGYLGALAYDIFGARQGFVPAWYPRLRWPLTGIALVCLFGAILGGPL